MVLGKNEFPSETEEHGAGSGVGGCEGVCGPGLKPARLNVIRALLSPEWVLLAVVCVTALAIISRQPLSLGGDEGMEFSKAMVLVKEPGAAATMWNDQPWLYSQMLALSWTTTLHWAPARMLSAGMFAAMVIAVWSILGARASWLARVVVLLVLLLGAQSSKLICSAMLELPACASVICGGALLCRASKRAWLAGGLLIGLGISIKLTAAILLPAVAAMVLQHIWQNTTAGPAKVRRCAAGVSRAALWSGVGAICVVLCSMLLAPHWGMRSLLQSHVSASAGMPASERAVHTLRLVEFLEFPAVLLLAAMAFARVADPAAKRARTFGVCGILTAGLVHLNQQPFWSYYMFHFAPPAAALAGIAADSAARWLKSAWQNGPSQMAGREQVALAMVLFIPAFAVAFEIPGGIRSLREVFGAEPSMRNPIVMELFKHKANIQRGYSADPIYLAQAGIVSIPDLALMPAKRFWSGALTEQQVCEIVQKSPPEAIILQQTGQSCPEEWEKILTTRYVPVAADRAYVLYLPRRFGLSQMKSAVAELQILGLPKSLASAGNSLGFTARFPQGATNGPSAAQAR